MAKMHEILPRKCIVTMVRCQDKRTNVLARFQVNSAAKLMVSLHGAAPMTNNSSLASSIIHRDRGCGMMLGLHWSTGRDQFSRSVSMLKTKRRIRITFVVAVVQLIPSDH